MNLIGLDKQTLTIFTEAITLSFRKGNLCIALNINLNINSHVTLNMNVNLNIKIDRNINVIVTYPYSSFSITLLCQFLSLIPAKGSLSYL